MKYVTVKVTNVEEAGEVTLPGGQPQVGTEITAVLADSDVVSEATVKWQWFVGAAPGFTPSTADGENAIAKATSASYTPVADDAGMYLKARGDILRHDPCGVVRADLDNAGITTDDDPFTNVATSEPSLQVNPNPSNSAPEFDEGASTERFVLENTVEDMGIGDPVTATDEDEEILIYTLGGRRRGHVRH